MKIETLVRISLIVTAPFNLLASYAFAFPDSAPGLLLEMPTQSHVLYTSLSGLLIALFGIAYAWLALQPRLAGPLLVMGAVGKLCAALLAIGLFAAGQLPLVLTAVVSCDLLFAGIWFYYLTSNRSPGRV